MPLASTVTTLSTVYVFASLILIVCSFIAWYRLRYSGFLVICIGAISEPISSIAIAIIGHYEILGHEILNDIFTKVIMRHGRQAFSLVVFLTGVLLLWRTMEHLKIEQRNNEKQNNSSNSGDR